MTAERAFALSTRGCKRVRTYIYIHGCEGRNRFTRAVAAGLGDAFRVLGNVEEMAKQLDLKACV